MFHRATLDDKCHNTLSASELYHIYHLLLVFFTCFSMGVLLSGVLPYKSFRVPARKVVERPPLA